MTQSWFERRFANLSLTTKGMLVVALPVCALLIAMALFFQSERESRRADQWVVHTYEVRGMIRDILILMVNAETGTRGYLLTGSAVYLEPYMTAIIDLPQRLQALRRLAADNPRQIARLDSAQRESAQILAVMQKLQQEVAAGHEGGDAAEVEAGHAAMERLRSDLAWMVNEEEHLLTDRRETAAASGIRLEAALIGGGVLGLLGGCLAAVLFVRGIVRRMHGLARDAGRLALDEPLEGEVAGRDEIALVERTLQETSRRLAAQSQELTAAKTELERRVERRTAELLAANQLLEAVMEASPLAIWTMDLDSRVTFWNPAAEKMFGWTAAEIVGHPLPIIPDAQREEFRGWLERYCAGEALAAVERQRRRKDGSLIDVSISTAPLRDAAGRIQGVMAIDADVTQRKVLEEQFRQSQKLEAVGRLAGGVAHDFNNLLTVIGGYAEMLSLEVKDAPDLTEFADEIRNATNRGGALTTQLLAFSRRQISQPRVLDLNLAVAQSIKMLRRVIGEDIRIEARLSPGLGRVQADPIHIDQVLMNLVVNARDAMGGGRAIAVETSNVVLVPRSTGGAGSEGRPASEAPGNYCLVAVSDTGCGMTAETRSRLFEPFFTTKDVGKGTGLGLSIVYGIVKQNGGEIEVDSELGRGTTFRIYLPAVDAPADSIAGYSGPERPGSGTVLLCEDEQWIRKLVSTMLSRQGYHVLESQSPEHALEIVSSPASIDLLLTDIVMPEMNGFDLVHRARQIRPAVKILYMSGYADTTVGREWVIDPEVPFLPKPFTAQDLSEKVREALQRPAAEA